ncbi:MAG: histidine phosphatase family protein [Bacillota bacterium]
MTRVVLIRHGETRQNRAGIMQGRMDVPLSDVGQRQAEALGRHLGSKYRLDRLYSSQLLRAQMTAKAIQRHQDCELVICPELREIDVGRWQGLSYRQAREQFPDEWAALETDPWNMQRPAGESYREVSQRVLAWLTETVERAADRQQTVAIVTHGMPVRAILAHALGACPVAIGLALTVDNTGVSLLEYSHEKERWQVRTVNCTCHLE